MDWYTASGRTVAPPALPGLGPARGGFSQTVSGWWRAQLALQQGRAFLWAPVAFVTGLQVYYGLTVEPHPGVGLVAGVLLIAAILLARRGLVAAPVQFAAFMLAGLVWGQVSVALNPVTMLPGSTGKITISGWVEDLTIAEARTSFILRVDTMDAVAAEFRPERIRVTARGLLKTRPQVNDHVRFEAWAYAPLTPVAPGTWDYGRAQWFAGIGGAARLAGPVVIDETRAAGGEWRRAVANLRTAIADRIRASLPPKQAGFAVALITGDRSGLDKETREALQLSGLAHILAISGLHMSLVAGGMFWLARALMALWPALALHWPIKKLAALAGLCAAAFYLVISGQAIATQRAFIMVTVMFVAILAGRNALSMRNLAVAAFIVLLMAPYAALSPSFEMSFLAVAGLIAAYEGLSGWQRWVHEKLAARSLASRIAVKLLIGLLALSATTLVASAFTALPAAWHFNRFATWSLPANMLAMPAVTMVVMPGAVAAVIAMPLGLEWLPLQVMRLGLDVVVATALWVAAWPGAGLVVPAMVAPLAFLSALGIVWLALWRGPARWAGVGVAAVALVAAVLLKDRPDILVERAASTMAARLDGGQLVPVNGRRGRFAVERWLLSDGDGTEAADAAKRTGWQCESNVCRSIVAGHDVLWLDRKAVVPGDCARVAIVVSAEPLKRKCGRTGKGRVVIDRFDVWRHGAIAIHVDAGGALRVETARAAQGKRPWAFEPVSRRKLLVAGAGAGDVAVPGSATGGVTQDATGDAPETGQGEDADQ